MSVHELNEAEDRKELRLDLALWRRILGHARPYGWPIVGLAASGLVVAITDALIPLVTGWVIDSATGGQGTAGLVKNSLYYLGLVAVMSLLIWFFIIMAGQIATGFAHDVRRAAFARLQDLSFSFYDRHSVGWLMARLTSDCQRLASVIPWTLLDAVWGVSLLLGISVMMLVLNWQLALMVMMVIPPMALVSIVFQRYLLRSQRAVRKTNSLITGSFNEGIMGVRTSKTLVREKENLAEFQVLSSAMYRHSVRNALAAAAYLPIMLTIGSAGVGLALWRGGLDVAGLATAGLPVGERMTLGTLVAFMQYAALFYIPIQEMAARFTGLQAAQASAERLQGLLDTEPEIRDSPAVAAGGQEDGGSTRIAGTEERIRQIEFRNVSFAYADREPVLVDFNLRVDSGERIALVGATGSGKTTIVSLLCRFYEPTRGVIAINGIDYRERGLMWLQSRLGIVLQSPHLFSGSIRDNIRYGRLAASDEEVIEAARLVNADRFIAGLEDGLDTHVGEGGSRLSTGQRQLIALARAILADPEIFVMDEATSSVDTETERLIQDAIEAVLAGRMSFIIAHRLSTIRSADRILVIDRGRIREEGSHEELLARRGEYHRLYTQQFARESEAMVLEGRGSG